jgi:hypothetical protein
MTKKRMERAMTRKYSIALDRKLVIDLRSVITERIHGSVIKRYEKRGTDAWDCICAIMERVEDTVEYLNSITIEQRKHPRSPFDFFDFICNADVLIGSIDKLAEIYDVDLLPEDRVISIFNKRGRNGKGTDKKYFRYLRSLCVIHPLDTSRHKEYQDGEFECCPFVVWNNGQADDPQADLWALVYTNDNSSFDKGISIKIPEVIKFIEYRYALLGKVIEGIKVYLQGCDQQFRDELMKNPEEFEQYTEYLTYLKEERGKRTGNYSDYEIFDYVIRLFGMKISNKRNQALFDEYREAFRIAIAYEHNAVQNMEWSGLQNTGIGEPNEAETSLLHELFLLLPLGESASLSNDLSKLDALGYESGRFSASYDANVRWRAHLALENEEVLAFLGKAVYLDEGLSDFETFVLVQLALFQNAKQERAFWLAGLSGKIKRN